MIDPRNAAEARSPTSGAATTVDLRSDTVTQPTAAMRQAMAAAVLGDDVFGEDPTVNALEQRGAAMLGKEAALLMPSGTQSNLVALLTHCQRGDEYLAAQNAHCYRYEGGGAAVLGGIQPQPIGLDERGLLDLEQAEAAIKPRDFHFARTRLLCIENTHGGRVWPLADLKRAWELARRYELRLHLDGARLFHAAIALGVPAADIAQPFDTVSICLSKGLCAPVGTLLVGGAATIAKARRWRKVVGGGMRQAGVVAAAGLVALDQQVDRLAEDHEMAQRLAAGLAAIDCPSLRVEAVETNMVWLTLAEGTEEPLRRHLAGEQIKIEKTTRTLRLVTHQGVASQEVARVIDGFESFFQSKTGAAGGAV